MARFCGFTSSVPRSFTPRRGEQGGARLHLLHTVTDQTIDQFSITDKKAHDSTEFDTGPGWKDG